MELKVAFDNFAKFFTDEEVNQAEVPTEIFRDDGGKVKEIRIYNVEYEQIIIVDRSGNVYALSVEEYESNIKF